MVIICNPLWLLHYMKQSHFSWDPFLSKKTNKHICFLTQFFFLVIERWIVLFTLKWHFQKPSLRILNPYNCSYRVVDHKRYSHVLSAGNQSLRMFLLITRKKNCSLTTLPLPTQILLYLFDCDPPP